LIAVLKATPAWTDLSAWGVPSMLGDLLSHLTVSARQSEAVALTLFSERTGVQEKDVIAGRRGMLLKDSIAIVASAIANQTLASGIGADTLSTVEAVR